MYAHTHIYKHIYSVCSGIVCLFTPPPPTLGHFIACWFLDQSEKLLATWLTRTRNKTDTLSDSETIPETDNNNNKCNKIGGQRKEQQQIHGKIFVCLMRDKNNHKRHTKRKRQRWRDGDGDRDRENCSAVNGNGEWGTGKNLIKNHGKTRGTSHKSCQKERNWKWATRVAFSKAISNCNFRILQIEIECEASVKKFLTKKSK